MTALLRTARFSAALGFVALGLTDEISAAYLIGGGLCWLLAFALDRQPEWGKRLRRWETAAVMVMVVMLLADFFFWGNSVYLCVAHFLMLFQMFKLLGEKTRKDSLQILVFSFFQMLSACTLSVDAWQAIILFLLIPTMASGLFWNQIAREQEESDERLPTEVHRPYRLWVTGLCLAAIPINLFFAGVIFLIFPRLGFRSAFVGLGGGRSGYNEEINLAQSGVIGNDSSTVLYLKITPAADRVYWKGYLRGTTLDFFDGKLWKRSKLLMRALPSDGRTSSPVRRSQEITQSITLVNTEGSTIFGSPMIHRVIAPLSSLQEMTDGSVRWTTGWRKPLRYDVVSVEQPLRDPVHRSLPDYLQLPKMSFNKTQTLLKRINRRNTPLARAQAIERYLKENFAYSLDLGKANAENPVEDFLFVTQRGPCGHFATSMAVMLRLQGIPSRVVAGYYKGVWNERLEQYLILERDAHAWVEAYMEGTGWVMFDPTPRVAAVSTGRQWMLELRKNWEFVNYQWARLVIEYDLYSQLRTVEDMQSRTALVNAQFGRWLHRRHREREVDAEKKRNPFSTMPFTAYGIVLSAITVLGLVFFFRWRQVSPYDAEIAFYQKFLEQMARKGVPKKAFETGHEYVQRLSGSSDFAMAQQLTQRYYAARFPGAL